MRQEVWLGHLDMGDEMKNKINLRNKKAQERLMLGMTVLLFGALGILFWGLGIIQNSANSIWIGKIILALIGIIVLIIERFIK